MSYINAFLLGILQGVAEFLPISSSGHLLVAKKALGLSEIPILFDVILHVATLLAVMIYFRRVLVALLLSMGHWMIRRQGSHLSQRRNRQMIGALLWASLSTGVLGLIVRRMVPHPSALFASWLFLVTGLLLFSTRFFPKGNLSTPDWRRGLLVGIAQGLGVLPGISRSGITITAGLALGLTRQTAGTFSFLASLPAILGALLLSWREGRGNLFLQVDPFVLLCAFSTSFVVGILSLHLLMRLVRRGSLSLFGWYLVPLGLTGILSFT